MKILLPGTDALEEGKIDEKGTDISKYFEKKYFLSQTQQFSRYLNTLKYFRTPCMKHIETSDSMAYINIMGNFEHTLCSVCQDIDEDIYLSN